jgi:predicted enzyme related to lactoylglutathione lyase
MSSIKRVKWIDMIVPDADATSQFYCNVFGFQREGVDEGGGHTSYQIKDGPESVLGICAESVFPDWVRGWVPYIEVEDYDHSIFQIKGSGGEIHREMAMNFNWEGQRFCLAIDPSGAPVMICEAAPRAGHGQGEDPDT